MNGQPWKAEHTRLLEALAGLVSDAVLAGMTGHATRTIRRQRDARGLPAYHPARYGTWDELPETARQAIRVNCR